MLWIICLILAAVCIGIAVTNLFSPNERSLVRVVKMVLYLAGASFLLYLPIFFLQNNFFTALAADIINVMRVVSLDAGYLDNKDFIIQNIGEGLFFRIYMAAMGFLHFLMPLLSIMAVYSIFFMFFSHIRVLLINLQTRRPVFIFNTSDNRAVLLAADIQKHVSKGAFIFAGIKDKSQRGEVDVLDSTIIHPDSIENIKIRRKHNRDIYYFLLSDDEDTNIKEALDQIVALSASTPEIQKHTHIYVSTHHDEAETLLDSSQKGEIDIHTAKMEEIAAFKLLDAHPLDTGAENGIISVLIIGLDSMAETLIRTISWCGQVGEYKLKINVAGIGIADRVRNFRFHYPGYADNSCMELNFYDCAGNQELYDTIISSCKDTTYAVITQGSDMKNAETAIRLRREFLTQGAAYSKKPEIYVYVRNEEQADVVDTLMTSVGDEKRRISYELVSFGSEEDIFTYDTILDSDIKCLSESVYLEVESLLHGKDMNVSDALARYNMLEINKRSSLAYAMHIRYKLSRLELDYSQDAEADEADLDARLTEDKLDELTRIEHDRWQMFLISEGWSSAEMTEAEAFKDSDISQGKIFSPILKKSPFICSFDEIETRSERFGCKNVADFDRELIRRIPDILHDRWGVLGKEYKIISKK